MPNWYIKFQDTTTVYKVDFYDGIEYLDPAHIIVRYPSIPILDTSGFTFGMVPDGSQIGGDYRTSTTIFNVVGTAVTYSSDGSHYLSLPEIGIDLPVGDTHQLVRDSYGTITWASDNEEVATVDQNGVVTGIKMGQAIVTATCGTSQLFCYIFVA